MSRRNSELAQSTLPALPPYLLTRFCLVSSSWGRPRADNTLPTCHGNKQTRILRYYWFLSSLPTSSAVILPSLETSNVLNTILKKVSVLNLLSTSSVMMTLYLGDLHDIMTTVLADHLATLPQNSAVQDEPRPKLLQSIDCHCCIAW